MIMETLVVGPLEVNCYLLAVAPGREAVVIDPGGDGERILARLHEQNLSLKAILNTHGHFDHVGANRFLKEATGAEIVIHEKDAPMLPAADELARLFGGVCDPSPPADRFVSANEAMEIAGLTFKVHHTPGHSEGGVCFQVGTALFVGDTLFAGSIGRTDLAGGSFRDLMISIQEKILPLGDHITLYPGHGPSSTIAKEKRTNPYLTELRNPYF
jgi:hydroxyacylglutathione hydrolase